MFFVPNRFFLIITLSIGFTPTLFCGVPPTLRAATCRLMALSYWEPSYKILNGKQQSSDVVAFSFSSETEASKPCTACNTSQVGENSRTAL